MINVLYRHTDTIASMTEWIAVCFFSEKLLM